MKAPPTAIFSLSPVAPREKQVLESIDENKRAPALMTTSKAFSANFPIKMNIEKHWSTRVKPTAIIMKASAIAVREFPMIIKTCDRRVIVTGDDIKLFAIKAIVLGNSRLE